jgi:hypothetical protein
MFGLLIWALSGLVKERRLPGGLLRIGSHYALAAVVFAAIACANPRGPRVWTEFIDHISVHTDDHRFGGRRIGLQHFFTRDLSAGLDWHAGMRRRDAWERQRPLWIATAAALTLLWLLALLRPDPSDPLDAMVLGLVPVFAWIALSRYYWGAACLLFLLGARGRDGPMRALLGAAMFLQVAGFYLFKPTTDVYFAWFVIGNAMWALVLVIPLIARLLPGARRP